MFKRYKQYIYVLSIFRETHSKPMLFQIHAYKYTTACKITNKYHMCELYIPIFFFFFAHVYFTLKEMRSERKKR